jgi:hypothetical protein
MMMRRRRRRVRGGIYLLEIRYAMVSIREAVIDSLRSAGMMMTHFIPLPPV